MQAFRCGLSLVSLVFGEVFFLVGVHPYMSVFCTFCKVLFLCLVSGVFLGDGMKGYGVFWNITGMVCVEQVLICTPVSIRKAFARMCDAWGGGGGKVS